MHSIAAFLPFLVVLAAFMFFASRRQRRAMQATIDLHESLRVGDRVHTTSGMEGTITAITNDDVELEIAPGVVTTWLKLAVRDRIETDDEDDSTDLADSEDFEGTATSEIAEIPDVERLPSD
ncbi:MAG TPA: preprotein translocase subunit YajC [Mycobacterium sp.]|nr:preprotein translocase subunit YajC [Mycobacterium sp.]